MLSFIKFIAVSLFNLFRERKSILLELAVVRKEHEILKRKLNLKRIRITRQDKLFFVLLNMLGSIRGMITIFSPSTLLSWQRMLINNFWTFFSPHTHPGRPPVPPCIKQLILDMKNSNLNWGTRKIRDELLKLDIDLHRKTIQNIINEFHRRGKIRKSLTWKQFLENHIDSLFAMDYFTVDTVFNRRYYVFFIIAHKTREIVQFAVTPYPVKEFVRQQIIDFSESFSGIVKNCLYLIHDRDPAFMSIDYQLYGIQDIVTSVKAPNMNSIAERFVRSVRNEALDSFIIFSQKQTANIIAEYIQYYNTMRPHQGINSIPRGIPPDVVKSDFSTENIRSKPVLGGLHHHYYRKVA